MAVEVTSKSLKGDLAVRPIYDYREDRIQAHLFVAFRAYCRHVSLRAKLRGPAPGQALQVVLGKLARMPMHDVHFRITDDRESIPPATPSRKRTSKS